MTSFSHIRFPVKSKEDAHGKTQYQRQGYATCRRRPGRRSCGSSASSGPDRYEYGCGVRSAARVWRVGAHRTEVRPLLLRSDQRPQARRQDRPPWKALGDASIPCRGAWAALDVPHAATASPGKSWRGPPCACSRTPNRPTRDIDAAMTNICRCGTYQRIRAACTWRPRWSRGLRRRP